MRLGYVRKVTTSGERTLLTVAIDRELYPDVVLLHPLRMRQQVNEGDRVRVMQEGENADALYAELVEVAGPVAPSIDIVAASIHARSDGGSPEALAFLSALQELRDYVATLTLPVTGTATLGGAVTGTAGPPTTPPSQPAGTTVLKGE